MHCDKRGKAGREQEAKSLQPRSPQAVLHPGSTLPSFRAVAFSGCYGAKGLRGRMPTGRY